MTTDEKLGHLQWYVDQVVKSNNPPTKQAFIDQGRGAAGAWFADMTISHEHYKGFTKVFDELTGELV